MISSRSPRVGPVDPTTRFSSKVDAYVRARPGYPSGLVSWMGVGPGRVVADIGSGTGIFTRQLLDAGAKVIGVEPNGAMRTAAEKQFSGNPDFTSVDGTAESMELPDGAVDRVVAAQAFHWFRPEETRREWARILKSDGEACIAWNDRKVSGPAFFREYEALLVKHGIDYLEVQAAQTDDAAISAFYRGPFEKEIFEHRHVLDWDLLRDRTLSCSYIPDEETPEGKAMLGDLRAMFDRLQQDGKVEMVYETRAYRGRLAPEC